MMLTNVKFILHVIFLTIYFVFLKGHRVKYVAENYYNSSLQIELPNGTIQGIEKFTYEERKPYLAFQGIPYAKAPVGPLRFNLPKWFPKWSGVLDATVERSSCYQVFSRINIPVSEDCLFLNVYTPKTGIVKYFGVQVPAILTDPVSGIKAGLVKIKNSTIFKKENVTEAAFVTREKVDNFGLDEEIISLRNSESMDNDNIKTKKSIKLKQGEKLPVMVFIYGGAFIDGFSNMSIYGPDYLLEQNVLFVSVNYRIGVFGFLSTNDLVCPGNNGLKDIILALSWLQANLKYFGGDPEKVTIFGQSAGAACVGYIIQAPRAKGLFSAAILQSGSALCPWSLTRDPVAASRRIGLPFGVRDSNSSALIEKLQTIDAEKLNSVARAVILKSAIDPINGLAIGPVIEPDHPEAVITTPMHELFKNGSFNQVPMIMGFCSQEASVVENYINLGRPIFARWDLQPSALVPDNMNLTNNTDKRLIGTLIKNFYFGEKYIAMSSSLDILNYFGDSQFVRPIRETAKLCSKRTPVYLYEFSYQGLLGKLGTPILNSPKTASGAGHVEDLWYIFKKENLTSYDTTDTAVRKNMVKLWTNFAKYNNPTPRGEQFEVEWPVVNNIPNTSETYLNIDSKLDIRQKPHEEAMEFWDQIYDQYGNPPYDNY